MAIIQSQIYIRNPLNHLPIYYINHSNSKLDSNQEYLNQILQFETIMMQSNLRLQIIISLLQSIIRMPFHKTFKNISPLITESQQSILFTGVIPYKQNRTSHEIYTIILQFSTSDSIPLTIKCVIFKLIFYIFIIINYIEYLYKKY
ncbi:unnamed protein product [Paramecium octaurelia]|uniref:Transmembrane protein n=1 Tax=Paramecium octaurelia TaxID=43137 RepID=A0A8S1WFW1_PAROT|nr:unnamed protein product [Paramecium octaurelia]